MKKRLLLAYILSGCVVASAQTCDTARRNFDSLNGAMVRDKAKVERAYQDMVRTCGDGEVQEQPLANPKDVAPQAVPDRRRDVRLDEADRPWSAWGTFLTP